MSESKVQEGFMDNIGRGIKNVGKKISDAINQISPKVPKTISEAFKLYVPPQGKADTVYGEICRAVNRVIYRHYNDGDKFMLGYGLQTAASSASYLFDNFKPAEILANADAMTSDSRYEELMKNLEAAFMSIPPAEVKALIKQKNTMDSREYPINQDLIDVDSALEMEAEQYIQDNWNNIVDSFVEEGSEPTIDEVADDVMQNIDIHMYRSLRADLKVIEDAVRNSDIIREIKNGIRDKDQDEEEEEDSDN